MMCSPERQAFSVKRPFGIDQAIIGRQDDKWSGSVLLRLHLEGLERFGASNGKITLNAAVSV